MKKLISIALCIAVFGVIGCATKNKTTVATNHDYATVTAEHKTKCSKCKAKKCHSGKFGIEKTELDTAK